MNRLSLATIDNTIIAFFKKISYPLARVALFVVYFWFGILKVVYESPANPLVEALLQKTLPFITFNTFIILLGCFEMLIGVLFIIPKAERVVMPLLAVHMVTTFMPLILLPSVTWSAPLVPTLEGQYIIKNVLIIALAIVISAQLSPLPPKTTLNKLETNK